MKLSLNSFVVALCLVLIASSGNAADRTWNRTSASNGTDWANAAYWTGGVPGTNDRAYFPNSGAPASAWFPTLSNNAVVTIAGMYIDGMSAASSGWQILNADSNNPATIVLGSLGISNAFSLGSTVAIQPDIQVAANQIWWFDPNGASGPTFYGNLTGTGSLTRSGGNGTTYYQRRTSPTFSGGVIIPVGGVQWNQTNLTYADSGAYGFGTGPITLANGSFIWSCTALTNNSNFIMNLTNSIVVIGSGGLLYNQMGPGQYPNCQFSGPVSLGGILRFYATVDARSQGNMPLYQGPITINQSNYWSTGLSKGHGGTPSDFDPLYLSSGIVDGPGQAHKPLILQGIVYELELMGTNAYAGGTVVSACGSVVHSAAMNALASVGPGSSLGTGNVRIEPGGRLRIYTGANNAVSTSATVTVNRTALSLGVLSLGTNWLPNISADSEGVIGIVSSVYSNAITDLSRVGNGYMFLGTDRNGGTFAGTTLAPGAGNCYRLGGGNDGGATLTISNNVLTGSASLQVGQVAWWGNSTVLLKGSNTFSGNIDVRGMLTMNNAGAGTMGSTLAGNAQTATNTSPFGATNGAVTLVGGALRVYGVSNGKPVAKGPVTYAGNARVLVDPTANIFTTTVVVADLIRSNNAVLTVNPVHALLGTAERLFVTNFNDSTFLPPYLVFNSNQTATNGPDFLWYDKTGGTGVRRYMAYNSNLLTSTVNDVVGWSGALGGGTYYAKALNVITNITGTGTVNLGDGTYAGLLLNGNISDPGATINFGSAEGIIFLPSATHSLQAKVSGSGGLTFALNNILIMTNLNNDFSGTVTVEGPGELQITLDSAAGGGSLGNTNNGIYLNGGILYRPITGGSGDRLLASRTLTLGPCGGWIVYNYTAMSIYSRITGPGALFQGYNGGYYVIAGTGNDYAGGTWVSYGNVIVTNGSTLGTGPVHIQGGGAVGGSQYGGILTIMGDNGICSTARVCVATLSTANFQSAAPVIGSLEDAGNVVLGTASVASTLTLGGDNTSFNFYGSISQVSTSKPGSVTKTGNGTFTLFGNHSFLGPLTVSAGDLVLMGAVTGNVNVAAGAMLQGSGLIGGSLTNNGTLALDLSTNQTSTLTVGGNLTLGSGSTTIFNFAGATNDTVTVAGSVTINGGTLVVNSSKQSAGTTSPLIVANGGLTGAFTTTPAGYSVKIVGNQLQLIRKVQGFIFLIK